MFHHVPLQEITGISSGVWNSIRLSSYIAAPPTCTGVILQIYSTSTNAFRVRKKGSTDSINQQMVGQCDAMVGVDANTDFEIYVQGPGTTFFYIKGYTSTGVTFFTNAYSKVVGVASSWQDVVCSEAPSSAIGLIFQHEVNWGLWGLSFGVRKKGSTDNRTNQATGGSGCNNIIVGCDASQTVQFYTSVLFSQELHLIGYITADITFNTNATDISLSSAGSYADLPALSTGPGMQIIEVVSTSGYLFSLRKKGETAEIYKACNKHAWLVVGADGSGITEGKIENTGVDFYLIGVCNAPSTRPIGNIGIGDCLIM